MMAPEINFAAVVDCLNATTDKPVHQSNDRIFDPGSTNHIR